mgnify:CR=1 FL=1
MSIPSFDIEHVNTAGMADVTIIRWRTPLSYQQQKDFSEAIERLEMDDDICAACEEKECIIDSVSSRAYDLGNALRASNIAIDSINSLMDDISKLASEERYSYDIDALISDVRHLTSVIDTKPQADS